MNLKKLQVELEKKKFMVEGITDNELKLINNFSQVVKIENQENKMFGTVTTYVYAPFISVSKIAVDSLESVVKTLEKIKF